MTDENNVGGTDDGSAGSEEPQNNFAAWLRKLADNVEEQGMEAVGGVVCAEVLTEGGATIATWHVGLGTVQAVGVIEFGKNIILGNKGG